MSDRGVFTPLDAPRMSRRELLTHALQAGAGVAALGVLAACGASSKSPQTASSATGVGGAGSLAASSPTSVPPSSVPAGTVTFMNYPGYMPNSEVSAFNKQYPQVKIHQVPGDLNGDVQAAGQVIQNKDSYDMVFLTAASVDQASQAGVLQKADFSRIPNIANVAQTYRTAYPWGFPTDYGKIGFAYRKDLISERPTTWKEFWNLIPKYSGKVVLASYGRDVIGSALLGLGYGANSTNQSEITEATKLVISVKPHLLKFAETNIGKPLAEGDAALTLDWDTDIAAVIGSNKNIVWVNPEEGMTTYLEGWVPVNGTKKLAAVEAIMNFFMQPKQYALYANSIPTLGTIPAAKPYLTASVRNNPALATPPTAKLVVENYLGADATKRWNDAWLQIQAA